MKEKFKVGDKVRIIKNENSSNNKIGDEGIITEIESLSGTCSYRVEVEDGKNWGNWSAQEEIELIK
jgi:ribosomal protein S17